MGIGEDFTLGRDFERLRDAIRSVEQLEQRLGRQFAQRDALPPRGDKRPYLVQIPEAGIPARSGTTLGSATCEVIRESTNPTPIVVADTAPMRIAVYNLAETAVQRSGDVDEVLAVPTAYGFYIAVAPGAAAAADAVEAWTYYNAEFTTSEIYPLNASLAAGTSYNAFNVVPKEQLSDSLWGADITGPDAATSRSIRVTENGFLKISMQIHARLPDLATQDLPGGSLMQAYHLYRLTFGFQRMNYSPAGLTSDNIYTFYRNAASTSLGVPGYGMETYLSTGLKTISPPVWSSNRLTKLPQYDRISVSHMFQVGPETNIVLWYDCGDSFDYLINHLNLVFVPYDDGYGGGSQLPDPTEGV